MLDGGCCLAVVNELLGSKSCNTLSLSLKDKGYHLLKSVSCGWGWL